MSSRVAQAKEFLNAAGWDGAEITSLAGDASFRRYDRVNLGSRKAVLMDAPPEKEDIKPFLSICRHLLSLSYSAPQIIFEDQKAGFILLEDFGDTTFTHRLQEGADEQTLYEGAVNLLIDLHGRPADSAVPPGLPMYDTDRYLDEAYLLTDWYMPLQIPLRKLARHMRRFGGVLRPGPVLCPRHSSSGIFMRTT